MRILLTAPSGLGKTTVCLKLLELASGLRVAGILSLPVFEGGKKIAIRLRNLSSGEERPLARLALPGEVVDIGVWHFDPETIAWAQDLLAHLPPVDLLLLDEIGPLELLLNKGLTHLIPALQMAQARWIVITVRPSLVENLRAYLEDLPHVVLELTEENRNEIPYQIYNIFSNKRSLP